MENNMKNFGLSNQKLMCQQFTIEEGWNNNTEGLNKYPSSRGKGEKNIYTTVELCKALKNWKIKAEEILSLKNKKKMLNINMNGK